MNDPNTGDCGKVGIFKNLFDAREVRDKYVLTYVVHDDVLRQKKPGSSAHDSRGNHYFLYTDTSAPRFYTENQTFGLNIQNVKFTQRF